MANLLERFRSAYNVFRESGSTDQSTNYGSSSYESVRHIRSTFTSEGSIVTKIYNQIAIDVASVSVRHVRLGQNGRYEDDIQSSLNTCLTLRPNIDQTSQAFFRDLVWTCFDHGVAAVVPVDTTLDIRKSQGFDVKSMRVGRILEWYPRHIRVEVYNDREGRREQVVLPKENVAVVNNPLYEVITSPNSDLRRLIEKLSLLDAIDSKSASGKLDMIIQLPYEVRSDLKTQQAKERVGSIADQLENSKYGIAYIGAAERVTQLNRPLGNNLMDQITYLTGQVYSALGLTKEVFDGTANETAMLNYFNRTVNPILDEITSAMTWGMLSQTARTQGQAIRWFRSPFALVPMSKFSEIATSLTTSEIATSNEIRSELGWKPAEDPNADQLRNSYINQVNTQPSYEEEYADGNEDAEEYSY